MVQRLAKAALGSIYEDGTGEQGPLLETSGTTQQRFWYQGIAQ
jgi:hypothetical protein